jgi:hypothetical protein
VYSPEQAERKYREFLAAKGPELKIGKDFALVRRLEELIAERGVLPRRGPGGDQEQRRTVHNGDLREHRV